MVPLLALQATFLYASLLRQLGHQGVQDMLGLSPGSTALPADSEAAATVLAAAATQLRQVRCWLSSLQLVRLCANASCSAGVWRSGACGKACVQCQQPRQGRHKAVTSTCMMSWQAVTTTARICLGCADLVYYMLLLLLLLLPAVFNAGSRHKAVTNAGIRSWQAATTTARHPLGCADLA